MSAHRERSRVLLNQDRCRISQTTPHRRGQTVVRRPPDVVLHEEITERRDLSRAETRLATREHRRFHRVEVGRVRGKVARRNQSALSTTDYSTTDACCGLTKRESVYGLCRRKGCTGACAHAPMRYSIRYFAR